MFLIFTIRMRNRQQLIRPLSARDMQMKEIKSSEEEKPDLYERRRSGALWGNC